MKIVTFWIVVCLVGAAFAVAGYLDGTRSQRNRTKNAWCTSVHSGEMGGKYCVTSRLTAVLPPEYLE